MTKPILVANKTETRSKKFKDDIDETTVTINFDARFVSKVEVKVHNQGTYIFKPRNSTENTIKNSMVFQRSWKNNKAGTYYYTVSIRAYGSDSYVDENGKKISSCWKLNGYGVISVPKTKTKEWENRLNVLFQQIDYWVNNVPDKTIQTIELFY